MGFDCHILENELKLLCRAFITMSVYFMHSAPPLILNMHLVKLCIVALHCFVRSKHTLIDTYSHTALALCKIVTDLDAAIYTLTH